MGGDRSGESTPTHGMGMVSGSAQSEEGSSWSDGAALEGASSVEPSDGGSDGDDDLDRRDGDLDRGDGDLDFGDDELDRVDGDLDCGDGGLDRGDGDPDGGVDGGGGDESGGDSESYKFPAFTPLSEERVKIVHDEIRQISPRARKALEEVGARCQDGCNRLI